MTAPLCPHGHHAIVGRNCSPGWWVCRLCGNRHPDCCAVRLPDCAKRPGWLGCDLVREDAAPLAARRVAS